MLIIFEKKEVDVGSFLFIPKWEQTHYLDYTYPVGVTNLRFMMPYPEQEQESYRLMAIFRPMNFSVLKNNLFKVFLSWIYLNEIYLLSYRSG